MERVKKQRSGLAAPIVFSALLSVFLPFFIYFHASLLELISANGSLEDSLGAVFGGMFFIPLTFFSAILSGVFLILAVVFWIVFANKQKKRKKAELDNKSID